MDYITSTTLSEDAAEVTKNVKASLIKPENKDLRSAIWSTFNNMGKDHAPLRSLICSTMNTFSSLRDELNQGITSSLEAQAVMEPVLAKFEKQVADYIVKALDSNPHDSASDIPKQLTKFAIVKAEMTHAASQGKLWSGYAPIIPLLKQAKNTLVKHRGPNTVYDASNSLNRSFLTSKGIPNVSMGGYVVLTKQFVLGVPRDYIKKHMNDPELAIGEYTGKHTKEMESLYAEVVESALSKHPGLEAIEVTSSFAGARWYWLISSKELALLRKASPGSLAFTSWAFAFSGV